MRVSERASNRAQPNNTQQTVRTTICKLLVIVSSTQLNMNKKEKEVRVKWGGEINMRFLLSSSSPFLNNKENTFFMRTYCITYNL